MARRWFPIKKGKKLKKEGRENCTPVHIYKCQNVEDRGLSILFLAKKIKIFQYLTWFQQKGYIFSSWILFPLSQKPYPHPEKNIFAERFPEFLHNNEFDVIRENKTLASLLCLLFRGVFSFALNSFSIKLKTKCNYWKKYLLSQRHVQVLNLINSEIGEYFW